jgi:hypothetical protein
LTILYFGVYCILLRNSGKTEDYVETDERLETLCEKFTDLEESEKDYILGVSQTLAHSIKGTMPPLIAGVKRTMSEYQESRKEHLA